MTSSTINSAMDEALATCDREPIHIPSQIQPHGVLLTLALPDLRVVQVSTNVTDRLGRSPDSLLNGPVEVALGGDLAGRLRTAVADGSIERHPITITSARVEVDGGARSFEIIAHRSGDMLVVELEPSSEDEATLSRRLYSLVRNFLARVENESTVIGVCQIAAVEIRRITGVDRVLIYQFDANWDGRVIAEDRNEVLPAYLGLKFPASDIPRQARALYRANRLRLIPDAGYEPVTIVPELAPGTEKPLDLSFSTLRSVSPIHVEYMRNMGTGSSMSISILINGELWGLISCHNQAPFLVPFEIRSSCDFLGQVLAIQIEAKAQKAEFTHRIDRQAAVGRLLTEMSEVDSFVDGLVKHPEILLSVTQAQGAAILHDGHCFRLGSTPEVIDVEAIADWLANANRGDVFATNSLGKQMPGSAAPTITDSASGLLAVAISQLHRGFILWFRPEVLQTESWGGDPTKNAPAADGRIHPRRSFEAWKETVRLQSIPWRTSEVEAANDLRKAILEIVLRRAEERAQLSAELERSNKELEAFSYSVSHDLRAPFRHIVGYAELLREEEGSQLSEEGKRYLATIVESAQFAGTLVDNLLAFSRMGRTSIHPVPIHMDTMTREVVREVQTELGDRSVEWKIGHLPEVQGDLMMLRLAMTNLISNAAKYTRKREHAVIEIEGSTQGLEVIFQVRDNGIGFDMKHVDKLFGVFQRLHRMEEFEGTGIGLANVRRIMSRHGGRAWAKGELNHGATFSIALPRHPHLTEAVQPTEDD